MLKIKLLILLLSGVLIGCSFENYLPKEKLKLSYIGNDIDGLILSELLLIKLKNNDFYDKESSLLLKANIDHDTNYYLTNIDKTSDRNRVRSLLEISIVSQNLGCEVYNYKKGISQFFLVSDSTTFTSNNMALYDIKKENTKNLVQSFVSKYRNANLICLNE